MASVLYKDDFPHIPEAEKTPTVLLLLRFIEQQHQNGCRALLIVDEAQDVNEEALE